MTPRTPSGARGSAWGFTRRDAVIWGAAAGTGTVAALVTLAAGGGGGAALTAWVACVMVVVVAVLGWEARPGAPVPPRRTRPRREGDRTAE